MKIKFLQFALLVASIIFLFQTQTHSQSGWEVQLGGGSISTPYYRSVFFINDNTGWILSQKLILKTTNGGANWVTYPLSIPSNLYLNSIAFTDINTGVATGYATFLTTNGGMSWSLADTAVNGNSVFFINAQTGWISCNGGIIRKTINSGQSWTSYTTPIPDKINDIYFTDDANGFAAADWGNILKTTNGGINWVNHYDKSLGFFKSIEFTDPQTGYVSGSGGIVLKTTNSGGNWAYSLAGNYGNINSINFINQSTGFAFGSFGNILKTTNAGLSWVVQSSTGIYGSSVHSFKTAGNNIWLLADSGMVYKTSNIGSSWNLEMRQFHTFNELNYIYFINPLTGWACGAGSVFLRTTSGGKLWSKYMIDSNYVLNEFYFLNDNTGYICGGMAINTGYVGYTANGGVNWSTVYLDSGSIFRSITFINQLTGWAAGNGGRLIRTTNGGSTWTVYNHGITTGFTDIAFVNTQTGFLASTVFLYKTTNSGVTLNVNHQMLSYSLQFFNSSTGFLINGTINNALFLKTTNGGDNWINYSVGGGRYNSLCFVNQDKGWIVGGNTTPLIKYTVNGGVSWNTQSAPINDILKSVHFINENEGWAAGRGGTIIHTRSGGIGIQQISNTIPKEFKLMQNYPNPFNPVTKIRFSILKTGTAKIIIYDILGRQVELLFESALRPGEYETQWDGSGYSSGIYFYRLITDSYSETKKMVLIR